MLTTVRLDAGASLGAAQDAGIRDDDILVFVAGTDVGLTPGREGTAPAVVLADAARIDGRLYAPNGTVGFGPAATGTGGVVARAVVLDRAARVIKGPSLVATPAGAVSADHERLPVEAIDGDVRAFRLEPSRQVRAEGLFARHGASFGLGPADTVVEQEVRRSADGGLHRRYAQLHRGLPVLGSDFIVQETGGWVTSGIGRLVSGLDIDPRPVLSERRALELALKAVGAPLDRRPDTPGGAPPPMPRGTLAIASAGATMAPGSFRLVYRFWVRGPRTPGTELIDINAGTGEIVNRIPQFAPYTTPGGGDTLHYGWKPFLVDAVEAEEGGQIVSYRLIVPDLLTGASGTDTPVGLWTVRALGLSPVGGPPPDQGFIWEDYVVEHIVDEDGKFKYWPAPSFEAASTKLPPLIYGVSVHWGLQQAVEYWKKAGVNAGMKDPWVGLDGQGTEEIVAVVDCPKAYGDFGAYFSIPGTLCFGTGGNEVFGLHVIGHEFAHGVSWHAAGIWYGGGEVGVLSEGFADLFGYLLDQNVSNWCGGSADALTLYYKDPGADGSCGGGTALCPGEQCDPTGVCSMTQPLVCKGRNLADPKSTQDPDTYEGQYYAPTASPTCDDGHCHQNSTIVGHWFYILVNCKQGTNDKGHVYKVAGIGRAKAEKIAQRTLLLKLWSSPTFLGVRAASIQAAEDLFGPGSPEVVAVTNAWYAVGVGDPRTYSPSGVSGVDPWPAVLKWEEFDGETDWEAQISTGPAFDTDVQLLGPQLSQATGFGKVMLGATVNLKPITKYYWRVRARSAPPPKKVAPADPSSTPAKKAPWVRSAPGWKAPGAGSPAGTVLIEVPSVAMGTLGGWGAWGATQEFVTGAKVPELIAPAPLALISGPSLPGAGTAPDAVNIVVAPGLYYPWNTDFRWKPVPGAAHYRLTVSESLNRTCAPSTKKLILPSTLHTTVQFVDAPKVAGPVSHAIPLKSDRTYYWWLMVYGPGEIPGGCAYGGTPVRFQTSAPKATLLSPGDGSKVSPLQTTLTWAEIKGAAGYLLQLAKPGQKFSPGETVSSTSTIIEPGAVGTFFWRVRPKGPLSGDMGAVSATWSFVGDLGLTKPQLEFPKPEHWIQHGISPGFTWVPVQGAVGYLLTIHHRNTDQTVGEVVAQIDTGFKEILSGGKLFVQAGASGFSTHTAGYCWT
ncbi:MAG: M4 family metallopeptidase, partial [Actinomycetota bacterium]